MGIIKRQGIKGTIISYIGAVMGAIMVMFLFPYCMNIEDIGLFRLILDAAGFFGLLSLFGAGYSITYFYPYYSDDHKSYNQFLSFILLLTATGFLTTVLLFFIFQSSIASIYQANSPTFNSYFLLLLPIIFFNNILSLVEAHAQNLYRIVVPKIAREIFIRIAIASLLILFHFKVFTFYEVIWLYIVALGCIVSGLIIYLIYISPFTFTFSFSFSKIDKKKPILTYSFFVILTIVGGILSNRLDSFFLSSTHDGLDKNGVYTTLVFMVMMMDMPIRSLLGISTPIINESMKSNALDNIEKLYKKSSITLLIACLIIFAFLWCNIDSIFLIMPKGKTFATGKWLILILGISKMMDASTSINGIILSFSKHYKYSLMLSLLLGLFTILTAYLLIPTYGLIGAAFSTAISMAIFQLLLTVLVYVLYKKQPFTIDTFKVFVSFGIMIFLTYLLPNTNPFLTIAYKSLIISILSYLLLFKLKVSKMVHEEIAATIHKQYPSLQFLL